MLQLQQYMLVYAPYQELSFLIMILQRLSKLKNIVANPILIPLIAELVVASWTHSKEQYKEILRIIPLKHA